MAKLIIAFKLFPKCTIACTNTANVGVSDWLECSNDQSNVLKVILSWDRRKYFKIKMTHFGFKVQESQVSKKDKQIGK